MIKVFTLNKNGKIELTKKELEQLLNESYWEGYRSRNHYWTYSSPLTNLCAGDTTSNPYTISANDVITSDSITIKSNLGD